MYAHSSFHYYTVVDIKVYANNLNGVLLATVPIVPVLVLLLAVQDMQVCDHKNIILV